MEENDKLQDRLVQSNHAAASLSSHNINPTAGSAQALLKEENALLRQVRSLILRVSSIEDPSFLVVCVSKKLADIFPTLKGWLCQDPMHRSLLHSSPFPCTGE